MTPFSNRMNAQQQAISQALSRDCHRCVACGGPAAGAYPIIDGRLWADGGCFLDNLASLCEPCRARAETTELSCDELRAHARIENAVLPEILPQDQEERYDRWGNLYLDKTSNRRLPGELFHLEETRRALAAGDQLGSFELAKPKYPRTAHFDWSLGLQNDDRRLPTTKFLATEDIVATEKMDGENTTMTRNAIYARSPDARAHPSRDWVRALHGTLAHDIPEGWRICGENVYAKHSIGYDSLSSYFLVFSVWDERNWCLSWDDTLEWCSMLGLETVRALYRGPWNEPLLRNLADQQQAQRETIEGYVVRASRSFPFTHFGHLAAKRVRDKHVSTGVHWMREAITVNGLGGASK